MILINNSFNFKFFTVNFKSLIITINITHGLNGVTTNSISGQNRITELKRKN